MIHAVTAGKKLKIATHLVGMNTRALLRDNLSVVQQSNSEKEEKLIKECRERYLFIPFYYYLSERIVDALIYVLK